MPPEREQPLMASFAVQFIGVGMYFFATLFLWNAITGGEVWDKSADAPMTVANMLGWAALLGVLGAGAIWGGARMRR